MKRRLARLERATRAGRAEVLCEECGECIAVPHDIALRLTTEVYLERRAERRGEVLEREPDPYVEALREHPHDALVDLRTGNPPGLPRGY